jgi:hypothetical protein
MHAIERGGLLVTFDKAIAVFAKRESHTQVVLL